MSDRDEKFGMLIGNLEWLRAAAMAAEDKAVVAAALVEVRRYAAAGQLAAAEAGAGALLGRIQWAGEVRTMPVSKSELTRCLGGRYKGRRHAVNAILRSFDLRSYCGNRQLFTINYALVRAEWRSRFAYLMPKETATNCVQLVPTGATVNRRVG